MEGVEDYFLSNRSVTWFPLMMTFIGGQVGGGLLLGAAQEASHMGWWVILYPLGQVLGILWLALGLGKRMARFSVSTIAQIFTAAYQSIVLQRVASVLSMVSLFLILVAQILATKSFLVSLGISSIPLFLFFWSCVLSYTGMGGFKAVIKTDVIQASFFVFLFGCAFFMSSTSPQMISMEWSPATPSWSLCMAWLIMPLLFATLEQDMGQRCFAAKSPRTLRWAAVGASLVTLAVCLVPIYFGILSRSLGISDSDPGSCLMGVLAITTSPMLTAAVGAAVLAAILATSDSLLQAISSNIALDFSWFRQQSLSRIRWIAPILGSVAILLSFCFDSVVGLLIQAYELSVCTLSVPLLFALFRKGPLPARAAWGAILGGGGVFAVTRFFPNAPKEILGMAASLLGYVVADFGFLWSRFRSKPGSLPS